MLGVIPKSLSLHGDGSYSSKILISGSSTFVPPAKKYSKLCAKYILYPLICSHLDARSIKFHTLEIFINLSNLGLYSQITCPRSNCSI